MCDCICRAPISNTARCSNTVFIGNHCVQHHKKAKKLYQTYKTISTNAYALNLSKPFVTLKEQISYLLNCYTVFIKAYNSRMEYKKYALVPEFWDWGHEIQFRIFQGLIDKCELLLTRCHNKASLQEKKKTEPVAQSEIEEENSQDIDKKGREEDTPLVVKNFKKTRKKDIEAENKELAMYIDANRKHKMKKVKNAKKCAESLHNLLEGKNACITIQIFFIRVINELCKLNYFSPKYTPETCKRCNCGNYNYYSIKNYCKCVLSYTDLEKFIEEIPGESVPVIENIISKYKTLIMPLFDDLVNLYKIWDNNVMVKYSTILQWDVSINRMKLTLED